MPLMTSWCSDRANLGVLVHGGAGRIGEDARTAHAEGCRRALETARDVLLGGGSALDAVERAVVLLESDPSYNAGLGAALNARGDVELDAAIMEGRQLRAGAVCAVRRLENPIVVARAALEDGRHVLYAGEGAEVFAERAGVTLVDCRTLVTDRARDKLSEALAEGRAVPWAGGTVGAVARDGRGDLAAATSTGGTTGKHPGRIGDSPLIGAGTYADNRAGAASATGHGEGIIKVVLCHSAVVSLRAGASVEQAAREVISELEERVGSSGGIILVDREGRLAWARSTETMSWAAWSLGTDVQGGT